MLQDIFSIQIPPLIGVVVIPVALFAVGLLVTIWLSVRRQDAQESIVTIFRSGEYPKIHSIAGVPTFEQLTNGIEMDAKRRGEARGPYSIGLKQFNHYLNNRDGFIKQKRSAMAELSAQLSPETRTLSEETGIGLANTSGDELQKSRVQYGSLEPTAQIYAQYKKKECEALRTIANDMEKSVPRTDYTEVKSAISAGTHSLESIVSELPIPWQAILTINERTEVSQQSSRPPKQERYQVRFWTKDGEKLEDKKAVRDGKWLISGKHGLLVPFQEPIPRYEWVGASPVLTRKRMIVIDTNPGTEWETEFWRKGGYSDQSYLRARAGRDPEQLRKAYRKRQLRIVAWGINVILLAIILKTLAERYIQ